MNFTRKMNDGRHIFVFGSNLKGMHGAGAAADAARDWGAKFGKKGAIVGPGRLMPFQPRREH